MAGGGSGGNEYRLDYDDGEEDSYEDYDYIHGRDSNDPGGGDSITTYGSKQKKKQKKKQKQREDVQQQQQDEDSVSASGYSAGPYGCGTTLEAAFYDPAYETAAQDGQGKAAIELRATPDLLAAASEEIEMSFSGVSSMKSEDDDEIKKLQKQMDEAELKVKTEKTTTTEHVVKYRGFPCLRCCKVEESHVIDTATSRDEAEILKIQQDMERRRQAIAEARLQKRQKADEQRKLKHQRKVQREQQRQLEEEQRRNQNKYANVPEGILIYGLDTSEGRLKLLSKPHSNTDRSTLVTDMTIAHAQPSLASDDLKRTAIEFVGTKGERTTLRATEQRTAIAWMEALDMMMGRMESQHYQELQQSQDKADTPDAAAGGAAMPTTGWGAEPLTDRERKDAEEQYLTLAGFSNDLIKSGATTIPPSSSNQSGAGQEPSPHSAATKRAVGEGGIYYNITTRKTTPGEDLDDETLESIAKRRAVIKDSWDFYRMICSLLRDRVKYDELFRRMSSLDPVYPYLNSMTGLNDDDDELPAGKANQGKKKKSIGQPSKRGYKNMSQTELAKEMVQKAEEALPSLVEICKALAGSLGMEEVGVGPIKDVATAIKKAERKYGGNLLKVTDYCRALLVVKDFPTLLALLELARDSFGPLIQRVKLSTLKSSNDSLVGGYRDCKLNIELKDHICEIQVHLWPMWLICGVDGFRHYRHCVEYSTDSFHDPFDALEGLERKTRAEIIVMAEEAVAPMPLEKLKWHHEKYILDYFAEVGLFMKHGMWVWAETTLRRLIILRSESPDIGVDHHETLQLRGYLEEVLRRQGRNDEAREIADQLQAVERGRKKEVKEAQMSLVESLMTGGCINPTEYLFGGANRAEKQRAEEEEKLKKRQVKASKKHWRKVREERFKFLDGQNEVDIEDPTSDQ